MALPGVRTLDTESRHPDVTANMHSDDRAASPPPSQSLCPRFELPLLGGGWVWIALWIRTNLHRLSPVGSTSVSRTSCSMLSCSPLLCANAALWPNIASFSCTFLCCSPSYIHLHTSRTGCIYMSSAAMSLLSVSDPPTSGASPGPNQQFRSFYNHRRPGWSNWWHTMGGVWNTICCHDLF